MITNYFFYIIKKSIIITRKNFNIYKRKYKFIYKIRIINLFYSFQQSLRIKDNDHKIKY